MIARIRRYWPVLSVLFLLASVSVLTAATYTFGLSGTATSGGGGGGTIACDVGPAYTGSIPAPAAAVGFTHCAVNYDFAQTAPFTNNVPGAGGSATYTWSNLSTWLDVCGAAHSLIYGGGSCGHYAINTDGGTQVFDIVGATNDYAGFGSEPASIGGNDLIGFKIPQNFYAEFTWKQLDLANANGNGTNWDIWLYDQCCLGNQGPYSYSQQEIDFTETGTNGPLYSPGCNEWSGGPSGNYCSAGSSPGAPSVDLTQYNTMGYRYMVSAAGDAVATCFYTNGGHDPNQPCVEHPYICTTFNAGGGICGVQAPTQNNRLGLAFWVGGQGNGGTPAAIEEKIKSYSIWVACADWVDAGHPDVGNDYGTGAHQCGWSTPSTTP